MRISGFGGYIASERPKDAAAARVQALDTVQKP